MSEHKVSTKIPLASDLLRQNVGLHPLVRCLMQVMWPAFVGAALTVGLLFSVIDPVQIEWVEIYLNGSRMASYTLGFIVFWALFTLTCFFTWFLATTEVPKGKVGRNQRSR